MGYGAASLGDGSLRDMTAASDTAAYITGRGPARLDNRGPLLILVQSLPDRITGSRTLASVGRTDASPKVPTTNCRCLYVWGPTRVAVSVGTYLRHCLGAGRLVTLRAEIPNCDA